MTTIDLNVSVLHCMVAYRGHASSDLFSMRVTAAYRIIKSFDIKPSCSTHPSQGEGFASIRIESLARIDLS